LRPAAAQLPGVRRLDGQMRFGWLAAVFGLAAAAWLVCDKVLYQLFLVRFLPRMQAVPIVLWLAIGSPLLVLATWVSWQSRGQMGRAVAGSVALAAGHQLGRLISGFAKGLAGRPPMHDEWFGSADYWMGWAQSWPLLLVGYGILVVVLAWLLNRLALRWGAA
jgi:hypothetical protein